MSLRPNLFVIGATKCGTTLLHDLLSQHPEVFMSDPKELWHFNRQDFQEREKAYLSFFDGGSGYAVRGESTPIYSETLVFPHVPAAIHKFSPEAKIIYMVREPFSRFRSQWAQTLDNGHWARLTHYEEKMSTVYQEAVFQHPPFLLSSMYWTNVCNFRKYFSDEQIKIVFFEDFISDIEGTCADIFTFLGVDDAYCVDRGRARQNSSAGKSIYAPTISWYRRIVPEAIRKNVPLGLRRGVRDQVVSLMTPTFDHADLSPEQVAEVKQRLEPEVAKLYDYLGIGSDPWQFFGREVKNSN
ncbi:sulfotransferase [Parafrankia sp. BMG5.11]|uniref:sulfotransferase family protein n=1 Tax=Parafrankia sp. BMG5.11 TaxID=222540 RepID=UPI00103C3450|nr:sulfotransferase [Parafrankia sp. BMG5.11]TCJ32813.1 sulfotransferase [Parafrankia sp. BMG5.11]